MFSAAQKHLHIDVLFWNRECFCKPFCIFEQFRLWLYSKGCRDMIYFGGYTEHWQTSVEMLCSLNRTYGLCNWAVIPWKDTLWIFHDNPSENIFIEPGAPLTIDNIQNNSTSWCCFSNLHSAFLNSQNPTLRIIIIYLFIIPDPMPIFD